MVVGEVLYRAPDVRVREPIDAIFDADGIDMPTFGLCWTRREVCTVL